MAPLDAADFPFSYPTSGASEPLFHLIADYGNRARLERFPPRLVIFRGEYEGYKAYAEACGIAVAEYERHAWRDVADAVDPKDLLCLSQPSAIDGMPLGPSGQSTTNTRRRASRSMEIFTAAGISALFQVIAIDLALAGDNAIVIGLAAAGLPAAQRKRAILVGIAAATVLRIFFALITQWLLTIGPMFLADVFLLTGLANPACRFRPSGRQNSSCGQRLASCSCRTSPR